MCDFSEKEHEIHEVTSCHCLGADYSEFCTTERSAEHQSNSKISMESNHSRQQACGFEPSHRSPALVVKKYTTDYVRDVLSKVAMA